MKLRGWFVVALGAWVLAGCGGENAGTAAGQAGSGDAGGSGNPPLGCTDGGPIEYYFILGPTQIRMSSLNGPLCSGGPVVRPSCAFSYYDAILTVPDTSMNGSWTLPSPDVKLEIINEYPRGFTPEKGCFCEGPVSKYLTVMSGTITLEQFAVWPEFDTPASLELRDVGYELLQGTRSALVHKCPLESH
jgi:hypothetical protein